MHPLIREFYEHTSRFRLSIVPEWRQWMKPGYEIFKRLVAEPLGQAAIPSNIQEAQRGMVSTIDTIDLDGDEEIDIRGWIRTFADSGKPIYVGIYTSFRHDDRGYVSVGFPIPSANFTATLEPRNAGEHDLLLTSRSALAFPGHYLSSVDSERDALTVLKLLSFQEQIHVFVTDGELKTDHSFYLAGQRFLTLHYEIERLADAFNPAVRRRPGAYVGGMAAPAIVLLGPPGSGKGTQAARLRDELGFVSLSTGDLLREARAAGTELGRRAAEYMDRGELVPDDVVVDVIARRAGGPEATGRSCSTASRARWRRPTRSRRRSRLADLTGAVLIDVPDDVVVERISGRHQGRADDTPETVRERLRVYHRETEPLVGYYDERGLLRRVDGAQRPGRGPRRRPGRAASARLGHRPARRVAPQGDRDQAGEDAGDARELERARILAEQDHAEQHRADRLDRQRDRGQRGRQARQRDGDQQPAEHLRGEGEHDEPAVRGPGRHEVDLADREAGDRGHDRGDGRGVEQRAGRAAQVGAALAQHEDEARVGEPGEDAEQRRRASGLSP